MFRSRSVDETVEGVGYPKLRPRKQVNPITIVMVTWVFSMCGLCALFAGPGPEKFVGVEGEILRYQAVRESELGWRHVVAVEDLEDVGVRRLHFCLAEGAVSADCDTRTAVYAYMMHRRFAFDIVNRRARIVAWNVAPTGSGGIVAFTVEAEEDPGDDHL